MFWSFRPSSLLVCVPYLLCVFRPLYVCACPLLPATPALPVSWCGMWWLTQGKQLTGPGPCLVLAGPGGERLGDLPDCHQHRALSVQRITVISSATQAHTDTMRARYACRPWVCAGSGIVWQNVFCRNTFFLKMVVIEDAIAQMLY